MLAISRQNLCLNLYTFFAHPQQFCVKGSQSHNTPRRIRTHYTLPTKYPRKNMATTLNYTMSSEWLPQPLNSSHIGSLTSFQIIGVFKNILSAFFDKQIGKKHTQTSYYYCGASSYKNSSTRSNKTSGAFSPIEFLHNKILKRC